MTKRRNNLRDRGPIGRRLRHVFAGNRRRGVVSVLAMIFLVMFGSLAVAMAVASQGNVRTSSTHLHMLRAMSAAETGLAIAQTRLQNATGRFIVSKGIVDGGFGSRLWLGTFTGADGSVTILPAANGCYDTIRTAGVIDAVANSHYLDTNIVHASGYPTQPQEFTASGVDTTVYATAGWVRTPLIAVDANAAQAGVYPAAYQVTYAPLADGTDIRIIVTGYSAIGANGTTYSYGATTGSVGAKPVSRTIQQDFRIAKHPAQAILSPSRIMIGKNVLVNGSLGCRYTDVTNQNGDPIQVKSDFYGLDPALDARLNRFYQGVKQYDTDGDNRLRIGNPIEAQGLPGVTELQANNWPNNAFSDATHDGYVDDFDIFINFYDTNQDGKVVLSARLTAGTPAQGLAPEFTADDDLAFAIDSAVPDRNLNGIYGYANPTDNNVMSPSSAMLDPADQVLGYRDGVIDYKDQYAKIRGQLQLKTTSSAWATARGGSYASLLQGPLVPGPGNSATMFNASDNVIPDLDASSFSSDETPLQQAANGASQAQQVATQLGIATTQLATYVEQGANANAPQYWRANLNDSAVFAATGQHLYEQMPFDAPAYTDYYYRPRYVNMTFNNVQIPQGDNGLYINCQFIGVTYVRTYLDNTSPNWQLYGGMTWSSSQNMPVYNTAPLDKSDFLEYTTGNVADGPANYSSFPNPPVINGVTQTGANRNTKLYSNNIRFHNCLFVGSIVSDTPTVYTNVRNKLQFTGSTQFTTVNPNAPNNASLNPTPAEMQLINTSSMMLPNYSVDVGQFNAPTDSYASGPKSQNVNLQGTIVAGVMDIRGNAYINGAMFLTFNPVAGQGPLQQFGQPVGNTANFNCTLGYFGPGDGDGESVDPTTLPIINGKRIVGWDTDGDGIPDVPSSQAQPPGSTAIPFYGYGRIILNWNPKIAMPDGIMLPVSAAPIDLTYQEGAQ